MPSTVAKKIEDLGGRKFVLACVILLVSSVGFATGKLGGADWAMVSSIVMGAFAYGNSTEYKALAKKKDYDPAG